MSIKGNNEPPAQHHQCSCLVLSRHLFSLYRPLGHFDNITVLSVALELQHISYVIMIGLLILVQSAISLGQVLLTHNFLALFRHTMHHAMCKQTRLPVLN